MINYLKYIIVILLSTFVLSCRLSKKVTPPRNLERVYNASSSSIHPLTKVYNTSDTSSVILIHIFSKELLFNQTKSEDNLQARVTVYYNLYDLNNKLSLVDSLTTKYIIEKDANKSRYTYEIPVKTKLNNKYFLEIITTDTKRESIHYSFVRIDRSKDYNKQDFLVYKNNALKVNSFLNSNEPFRIKHYKEDFDSLKVFYYANNFRTPQPPSVLDTLNDEMEFADTNWNCYLDSINYLNFQKEGVYFFTKSQLSGNTESNKQNGFALYNFGDKFPVVRTPSDLIKPIAYLDSTKLKTDIEDSTGKYTKLAVDDFWLGRTNNIDKSRELLQIFYNRVMFANMYFTSYKEGWQTERGMIFIIYGIPNYVYKSGVQEKWIYNSQGVGTAIVFNFNYYEAPFANNHFILDRKKLKYTGWEEAVEIWNSGEIFYF